MLIGIRRRALLGAAHFVIRETIHLQRSSFRISSRVPVSGSARDKVRQWASRWQSHLLSPFLFPLLSQEAQLIFLRWAFLQFFTQSRLPSFLVSLPVKSQFEFFHFWIQELEPSGAKTEEDPRRIKCQKSPRKGLRMTGERERGGKDNVKSRSS